MPRRAEEGAEAGGRRLENGLRQKGFLSVGLPRSSAAPFWLYIDSGLPSKSGNKDGPNKPKP